MREDYVKINEKTESYVDWVSKDAIERWEPTDKMFMDGVQEKKRRTEASC